MTNQEAFNISYRHLLKQGKKSVHPDQPFYCMYRGTDGCMCALGPLIPDELYSPDMENYGIDVLLGDFPALADHLTGVSFQLLTELQRVHDTYPVDEWSEALHTVASQHELEVPDAEPAA